MSHGNRFPDSLHQNTPHRSALMAGTFRKGDLKMNNKIRNYLAKCSYYLVMANMTAESSQYVYCRYLLPQA